MSDRRALSAGNLAASSVAASEPWRVAVGGNRVQNMTVEQIAHAFAAGQLSVRTPLWPPGTSGWQALGNFEQFQAGMVPQPQGYSQLSQFEEADDDPTRMWTGSSDLSDLPGMEMQGPDLGGMEMPGMAPLPPVPSAAQRPSARTGPRQVSTRAPSVRSLPPPAPVARTVSAAPSPELRALRPRRSSGLWLVAGLVGLVGLGSAVLAARGSPSVAAPAAAPEVAAPAKPVAAAPAAPPAEAAPSAPSAAEPAKSAEAQATPPASEVNQAQLAKYEDTRASAFVAEGRAAPEKVSSRKSALERKSSARKESAQKDEPAAGEPKHAEDTKSAAKEKESAKVSSSATSSSTAKRATTATVAPTAKPKAHPAAEAKVADAKAEPKAAEAATPAVTAAVSEAAATALGNAAKLASSCRPRGGPSGPGKARVIYSNEGEVKQVEILTAKFRDTLTGSCVNMVFRRAKIAPFKGEPPTFIKSFTIPEE